jgi:hypothetical protein
MYAAHDRLVALLDAMQHQRKTRCIVNVLLARVGNGFAHPVNVGASAEAFASTAQHDYAAISIVAELCEGKSKLFNEAWTERVMHVGTVQF